jgi:hypothetical protein
MRWVDNVAVQMYDMVTFFVTCIEGQLVSTIPAQLHMEEREEIFPFHQTVL